MTLEYTIQEAINKLSISKATFYNRVKKLKKSLTNHIFIRNGRRYISAEGIEILKTGDFLDNDLDDLKTVLDSVDNLNSEQNKIIGTIELLKNENEFLRNQILEKDSQIKILLRLNENNQILLKQEQDNKRLSKPREGKIKTFFYKHFNIKK